MDIWGPASLKWVLLPSAAKTNGASFTWAVMMAVAGSTSGRTVSVCGAMGVRAMALLPGARMGPPTDRA